MSTMANILVSYAYVHEAFTETQKNWVQRAYALVNMWRFGGEWHIPRGCGSFVLLPTYLVLGISSIWLFLNYILSE